MEIRFERATKEDALKLIEVQDKAFLEDYERYGTCPGYKRSEGSMLNSINNAYTFKIIADNQIVGDIIVRQESEQTYHLGGLCVIPEYENKGIGQAAIAFIENYFKDAKAWTLDTPADKLRNHYFYQKCGFKIVGNKEAEGVKLVLFFKKK